MKIQIVVDVSKSGGDHNGYKRIVEECFGIPVRCISTHTPITVTCNGDQFARFIIKRDQRDIKNWIHALEAQIIYDQTLRARQDRSAIKKWDATMDGPLPC